MKISYNWLKEILDFKLDPIQTSEILTEIGLEVERLETYENIKGGLAGLLVGKVLNVEKHPNADRLNITVVNIGEEDNYRIVCGAPNVKKGQKVIVAKPGTIIYPTNGEPFEIKKANIRGEDSFGMICAKDEIGLGDDHEGIIVLDKNAKIGTNADKYFNIISDTIFEIGLTPNRADAMSHYGVARDLLAALKFKKLINSNTFLKALPKNSDLILKKKITLKLILKTLDAVSDTQGLLLKILM